MLRAMDEFTVEGPKTTLPLGISLLHDDRFRRGEYNTAFLDRYMQESFTSKK